MTDGRKRTVEQKHFIRTMATKRYFAGESPKRIAESYGVSTVSVHRWANAAQAGGLEALDPTPPPGRPRKLSTDEEQEVFRWVVGGDPRQLGLDFGLWTRAIIKEQIEERLGVMMSITASVRCFIASTDTQSRFVVLTNVMNLGCRNGLMKRIQRSKSKT